MYNIRTLASRYFDDMPVRALAPNRAVRVIPSEIWGQILQDWHNYQQNLDPEPPLLGRPGGDEAYFTDPESIFVCNDASDFGVRLSLGYSTAQGCAVVFFDTNGLMVNVPQKAEIAIQDGLTAGGVREWIINGNLAVDLRPGRMEAFAVNATGQRDGPVS